ncbi:MAG: DUF3592 domain-containing protein [Roseimicrobium sp.]
MPRWFPFVVAGLGLVFIAISGLAWWKTSRTIEDWKMVPGKVVRLEALQSAGRDGSSMRNTTSYTPVFSFLDEAGKEHNVTCTRGEKVGAYQRGDNVMVLYNPADPESAYLYSFARYWLLPVIFGTVGSIFLIAAIVTRPRAR